MDGFYKDKVSRVAKSIFCSAIKKYAAHFRVSFQPLAFEARMVARFAGCAHDRFMTIVDEGGYAATHGRAPKNKLNRKNILAKTIPTRIMRITYRSAAAVLE